MKDTLPRPALNVPYAMDRPDRVSAQRYYDPEFFAMENELLWPRVWQMACRLEDIPKPGDHVEYEILDQSVIVVRVDASTVKAYNNVCRHRGVKLIEGNGSDPSGFTCPFHGWCWGLDGANTFLYQPDLFDEAQRDTTDIRLTEVRAETALGCVFINFDKSAPSLRDSIEPFGTMHDDWMAEDLRAEWWLSCAMPTNWKLAMEAFMEGYHVMQTHPQLYPKDFKKRYGKNAVYKPLDMIDAPPSKRTLSQAVFVEDSRAYIDMQIHAMRVLSEGMAGMTHMNDVLIAEGLRDLDLTVGPESPDEVWTRSLNNAIMDWHRARGERMPDLNEIQEKYGITGVNFCFPHFFLLPSYSSASMYRIRPLTAETCLFELWSLTRYPPGQEPTPPAKPTPMAPDDERWPAIPHQDYANLPKQQKALHNKGFEFMRLSDKVEGMIANYQRLIDGYLAGLGYDELLPAVQRVSGAIDCPSRDLGF
jgi:phenylpropionate dioxygenase-like ring-hydroxylating dioxygenase large terminal subunit